ncbi:MAG TPA: hypothetical protein VFU88_20315 [Ktedonobacterales bacterium]|nr:hypothetical protein [Ktedonobacterales bacterium]
MANAAIFIGYGPTVSGHAKQALQVFGEAIQYYGRLQQQGQIESFEPVFLEPHGGDLAGFILLRGERDKLNSVRFSEEFLHLTSRATVVVENLGIVSAFLGEEQNRLFADFLRQASELE